jgi:Na+-driven multidrug efflux pump
LLGFLLVPRMGIAGAGIAASVAYTVTTFYQIVVFVVHSHCRPSDFLFTSKDFGLISREIKAVFSH